MPKGGSWSPDGELYGTGPGCLMATWTGPAKVASWQVGRAWPRSPDGELDWTGPGSMRESWTGSAQVA
ncbi:hypothetical protein F2Q69_00042980 [Brassica cretica]|uniref:Uncharacterized protein n=1 Tax=Brassica cretica TaxID=69181 RepID=A0A8S9N997_BRACR|nr:hypothetical protein F2Q69_00042980 [Brassica cretica]